MSYLNLYGQMYRIITSFIIYYMNILILDFHTKNFLVHRFLGEFALSTASCGCTSGCIKYDACNSLFCRQYQSTSPKQLHLKERRSTKKMQCFWEAPKATIIIPKVSISTIIIKLDPNVQQKLELKAFAEKPNHNCCWD